MTGCQESQSEGVQFCAGDFQVFFQHGEFAG